MPGVDDNSTQIAMSRELGNLAWPGFCVHLRAGGRVGRKHHGPLNYINGGNKDPEKEERDMEAKKKSCLLLLIIMMIKKWRRRNRIKRRRNKQERRRRGRRRWWGRRMRTTRERRGYTIRRKRNC